MRRKKWHFAKTKPQWGIAFFIGGATLLAFFIQEANKSRLIDKCPRYTIGYVTLVENKTVKYRYEMMGQKLRGFWNQNPRSLKDYFQSGFVAKNFIGRRFLLRVSCDKPEISVIDWSRSIPEGVTSAPEAGWQTIPDDFPKTEFAN